MNNRDRVISSLKAVKFPPNPSACHKWADLLERPCVYREFGSCFRAGCCTGVHDVLDRYCMHCGQPVQVKDD